MILDEQTAKDVIKNPRSSKEINSVKKQESQFRVFTEDMSDDELKGETYWNNLMVQMKKRSNKKFDRVIEFARYPLPVVQLSDSILNEYYRVFDGKNRYFNVNGDRDIHLLDEWIVKNQPEKWIEMHGRQVFKNKPNSFVVVDRNTTNGNPSLIYVDSERLVDAVFKDQEGNLEYICFIHSKKKHETKSKVITTFYSVYDDLKYYVFSKDSDSDSYIKVIDVEHGVGYCPAKSFIKTPSNSKNFFKRRIAFTSALSKMEDWTMFDIFRNYVDYYAPFPVTEAPRKKCANDLCKSGKVEEVIEDPKTGDSTSTWSVCPACEGVADGGQHIMPGTNIGIKVQSDKSANDGSGVFKMIFPETDKMKYIPEKLDDMEVEIRHKTIGINNLTTNEAMNELQVKGSFASMESVLIRVKDELDVVYKWVVKTAGLLIYTDLDASVEANFGTEFYLINEEDLQKRYKEAKSIGLPMEELLMIYTQLIETKYKGNNEKIERQKMILQLDPLPLYSNSEVIEMKEKNIIDSFDLSLKMNFLNFITKFENENAPVTEFGMNLDPWKRIEKIRETLNIYNNETIQSKQLRASNEGVE